jgi:hypothetical protein
MLEAMRGRALLLSMFLGIGVGCSSHPGCTDRTGQHRDPGERWMDGCEACACSSAGEGAKSYRQVSCSPVASCDPDGGADARVDTAR